MLGFLNINTGTLQMCELLRVAIPHTFAVIGFRSKHRSTESCPQARFIKKTLRSRIKDITDVTSLGKRKVFLLPWGVIAR